MQTDWTETLSVAGGQTQTVGSDEILTGWVIGAGAETFLAPNLLGRIEYLYEDFGSSSLPLAFTQEMGGIDATAQKLRIGLSMKF